MEAIRTILVTTDLSPASWCAWGTAVALAQKTGASLVLVHIVEEPTYFTLAEANRAGNLFADLERVQKRAVELAREELQRRISGLPQQIVGRLVVRRGMDVAAEVAKLAAEEHVDLVAISTHGRTGLSHVLLGSVAERIVRTSRTPVLTVRALPVDPSARETRPR